MKTNPNWFDISNDGWKRMNAGRPMAHLVREAISNVFDAPDATECRVTVGADPDGRVRVMVADDSPSGIKNTGLITTVFMTDKTESPTMRGRKGRGLKELISAADEATVDTVGVKIVFNKDGRAEILSDRKRGTVVTVVSSAWTQDHILDCITYLKRVFPPDHIKYFVQYQQVMVPAKKDSFLADLTTQIIEDGVQRDMHRETTITTRKLRSTEQKGFVHEMGIPVMEIGTPFHVDVAQRIPMNDHRDNVAGDWVHSLYGEILNGIALTDMKKRDLAEKWVLEGIEYANWGTKKVYSELMVGQNEDKKVVLKTTNSKANDIARQHGFKVVDISSMPDDTQFIIRNHIIDAIKLGTLIDQKRKSEAVEPQEVHKPFIDLVKTIAKVGINREINVEFYKLESDFTGYFEQGKYNKATGTISFNVLAKTNVLHDPTAPSNLTCIMHELAHELVVEHDEKFIEAMENIAGKVAHWLLKNASKVLGTDHGSASTVQHVPGTPPTGATVEIKCTEPGCTRTRMVKPQDVFQVKRCTQCQLDHQKKRAAERRQGRA